MRLKGFGPIGLYILGPKDSSATSFHKSRKVLNGNSIVLQLLRRRKAKALSRDRSVGESTQVTFALRERLFFVDYWLQGVIQGKGWTNSLTQIAQMLIVCESTPARASELHQQFPWFEVNPKSRTHEQGPAEYVTFLWKETKNHYPELSELITVCLNTPRLRALRPYVSMGKLSFSQTTGYPFSEDCPFIRTLGDGLFSVMSNRWSDPGSTLLESGTAAEAAAMAESHLPPNCGPARHGTG